MVAGALFLTACAPAATPAPTAVVEPAIEQPALPENLEQLQQILLYHVVPGSVMAADVVELTSADTAAELPIRVKVDGDKVMVNEAQVSITDIETANGVIHVIDSVLLPPQ